MSNYGISTTVTAPFDETVARVREALAGHGFGVLTEIDVAATMKSKLGLDMPAHLILGACNPPLAHKALTIEPSISLLLPCNITVRTIDADHTRVDAIDPDSLTTATGNARLAAVAADVRALLTQTLADISTRTETDA